MLLQFLSLCIQLRRMILFEFTLLFDLHGVFFIFEIFFIVFTHHNEYVELFITPARNNIYKGIE